MTQTLPIQEVQVAVVGAGPAGLHAAKTAAQAGAEVTLIDNYQQPGGQYFRQTAQEFRGAPPMRHQRQGQQLWREVQRAGVAYLPNTVVWGAFPDNLLALHRPGQPVSYLRAKAVILATGTYERVVAFPGWTLPGVMTVGGAQALLKGQRILPGRKVVLAGTGPLQMVVGAALAKAGAQVVAVLEGARLLRQALQAPLESLTALWGQGQRLREAMRSRRTLSKAGTPVHFGWGVVAAQGDTALTQVVAAPLDDQWRPRRAQARVFPCDTLCINYGFVPNTELAQLLGVELTWRPDLGGFVPVRDAAMETNVEGVFIVGDAAGVGGAALAAIEGEMAGWAAAAKVTGRHADPDRLAWLKRQRRREVRFQKLYAHLYTPGPGVNELMEDDTCICRCEEITQAQVREVIRQGADTLHAVKSLTRCGMGNCQGRMCGPIVTALVARETGQTLAEVGHYRTRPPIFPVPLADMAVPVATPGVEL